MTSSPSQCATMNNSIVSVEDKTILVSSPPSLHKTSLHACHQNIQHQQPAVLVTRTHFFLIMASLWIGNFTAYFNETTATTAMHIIAADFNDLANQNWLATSYLLGFTVTQTLLGKFADIFGRAKVFNGTMLIFAAGTIWCALATVRPYSVSRACTESLTHPMVFLSQEYGLIDWCSPSSRHRCIWKTIRRRHHYFRSDNSRLTGSVVGIFQLCLCSRSSDRASPWRSPFP